MKSNLYSTLRKKLFRTCFLIVIALMACIHANGQCTYYEDNDGDGYGNPAVSYIDALCDPPVSGYVANNLDCSDNGIHPYSYVDNDNDGFGSTVRIPCGGAFNHDDCDDSQLLYADNDGDLFGSQTFVACGGVTNNLDCNEDGVHPYSYEDNDGDGFGSTVRIPCGGAYNHDDCDDSQLLYADNDGDLFGSQTFVACDGVTNNLDCNEDGVHPYSYQDNDNDGFGSTVRIPCGGAFNHDDCDDSQVLYEDNDGDLFGSQTMAACIGVTNNLDCNEDGVHPYSYQDDDDDGFGSTVRIPCGGAHNHEDCDDSQVLYEDLDGDGFGSLTMVACGGVTNNLDCNDDGLHVYSYQDNDGDGFGSAVRVPCGNIYNHEDCDDSRSAVHPGATELLCDGLDNDCDGIIDAGAPTLTIDAGPNKIVYRGYPDSSCTTLQSSGAGGGVAPLTLTWSPGGSHASSINVCPTTSTVYYLTVTDANGCTKKDSVKVCVIDVRCGSGKKNVTICHGTGSALNPFTTLCIDKAGAKWHLQNHPGEQLGACGTTKGCNFTGARLADEDFPEIEDGEEFLSAYPNPFNNTTTIHFMLPENDFVNVKVFDISGREIANLFEGTTESGILYEVSFDGDRFQSGIYFLIMKTQGGIGQTKKLILSK